ncbi:hypothetical protein FRB98_004651 [Tulasnella sp. 332]|nr:hypothetical protein FRB98_004651 [Tulasnella sp. 332]
MEVEKGAGLPFRDNATSSFSKYHGISFLLIFGGTDKFGAASNELFVIDLTRCTWEPLHTWSLASEPTATRCGGVFPRCGTASTVAGDKLLIFGDRAHGHLSPKSDSSQKQKSRKKIKDKSILQTETINAYSVLDLKTRIRDIHDQHYPDGLDLGYNIDVIAPALYKGNKLLLMRGRTTEYKVGIRLIRSGTPCIASTHVLTRQQSISFTGDHMWILNTNVFTFTRQ